MMLQVALILFFLVQLLNRVWLFVTPWTAARQASLSIINSWGLAQTHVHWVGDAIQPSHPLSPPSPPALNLQLQNQSFQWIFSGAFLKDWLVWSPCSPRDSQESSPTPQLESISSLVLSFLYGSILTSIHDYWKNHSYDYVDLCWQSDVFVFLIHCLCLSWDSHVVQW